jgi:isopenicillin N synthase-like dioxygenase
MSERSMRVEESSGISILDFARFHSGSQAERQNLAEGLLESLKKSGFAYIVNHGISQEKVDAMFDLVRSFVVQTISTMELIA